MSDERIFDAWAPDSSRWSAWVKPVLFAYARPNSQRGDSAATVTTEPREQCIDISPMGPADHATAVVVDLPDAEGVDCGLRLAEAGYRPIPLYNSVPAPEGWPVSGRTTAINMTSIVAALEVAAGRLTGLSLPAGAPPAFLLDARRRGDRALGMLEPRGFDNRSISLPTDFPSANLLLAAGIRRVIVIQQPERDVQTDLAHTLRRWQDAGITMFLLSAETGTLRQMTVPRPPRFRMIWYGLLARLGLRRSPLGGYGGYLPEPSTG